MLRVASGEEVVVTTDAFVEDVHFRFDAESPARSAGGRCVANLSDLAAMGARPARLHAGARRAASLTLASSSASCAGCRVGRGLRLPAGGWQRHARAGDLPHDHRVGAVRAGSRAASRAGPRPGDRLFVTGVLGGAASTAPRRERAVRCDSARCRASRPGRRSRGCAASGLHRRLGRACSPTCRICSTARRRRAHRVSALPRPRGFEAACRRLRLDPDAAAWPAARTTSFSSRCARAPRDGPPGARPEPRLPAVGLPVAEIGELVVGPGSRGCRRSGPGHPAGGTSSRRAPAAPAPARLRGRRAARGLQEGVAGRADTPRVRALALAQVRRRLARRRWRGGGVPDLAPRLGVAFSTWVTSVRRPRRRRRLGFVLSRELARTLPGRSQPRPIGSRRRPAPGRELRPWPTSPTRSTTSPSASARMLERPARARRATCRHVRSDVSRPPPRPRRSVDRLRAGTKASPAPSATWRGALSQQEAPRRRQQAHHEIASAIDLNAGRAREAFGFAAEANQKAAPGVDVARLAIEKMRAVFERVERHGRQGLRARSQDAARPPDHRDHHERRPPHEPALAERLDRGGARRRGRARLLGGGRRDPQALRERRSQRRRDHRADPRDPGRHGDGGRRDAPVEPGDRRGARGRQHDRQRARADQHGRRRGRGAFRGDLPRRGQPRARRRAHGASRWTRSRRSPGGNGRRSTRSPRLPRPARGDRREIVDAAEALREARAASCERSRTVFRTGGLVRRRGRPH